MSSLRTAAASTDPATDYARDVCAGKIIAGLHVRNACARHLRDLEGGHARGLSWRPDLALRRIAFNRFLRHSKGPSAGMVFEFSGFQKFIHGAVHGWLRADGSRRFRTAYVEVGRKNGKSTEVASEGLFGLVADGESGADVFSIATKRDQARIIFDEARRMVKRSEALRERIKNEKSALRIERTDSKFEPLSSDDNTLDGLNPHMSLIDELHKHKSRAILDVMDTAVGARRQPLIWMITTAGDDDPETVYAQEHEYAVKVADGAIEDDTYFAFVAAIDAGDDWADERVWVKANPNLGVSLNIDDLRRQAAKAKKSPAALSSFLRLRLNVRQASTTQAIPDGLWMQNTQGALDGAALIGKRCYVGVDLSSRLDITAVVALFPPQDGLERFTVLPMFWMPSENVEDRPEGRQVDYRRWIGDGLISATPGNVIDLDEVESYVREMLRVYDVRRIAYDTWGAVQMFVRLGNEGAPVAEFVQGLKSYNAPSKELVALLTEQKIEHGGNAVLRWMAANLRYEKPNRNDNVMPSKKKSSGRIDGMTALIMALGAHMADAMPPGEMPDRILYDLD